MLLQPEDVPVLNAHELQARRLLMVRTHPPTTHTERIPTKDGPIHLTLSLSSTWP